MKQMRIVLFVLVFLASFGALLAVFTLEGNVFALWPKSEKVAAPAAAPAPATEMPRSVLPAPAPATEMPRSVLPAPAPLEGPEHVQAACMSNVRGLIPNGTRVNGMSVAYKHSVELSRPLHRQVYSISDVNFYTVTVEAEIEGRRFSSRYTCRQWGDAIEIMRR
jgi:hypothetical protein